MPVGNVLPRLFCGSQFLLVILLRLRLRCRFLVHIPQHLVQTAQLEKTVILHALLNLLVQTSVGQLTLLHVCFHQFLCFIFRCRIVLKQPSIKRDLANLWNFADHLSRSVIDCRSLALAAVFEDICPGNYTKHLLNQLLTLRRFIGELQLQIFSVNCNCLHFFPFSLFYREGAALKPPQIPLSLRALCKRNRRIHALVLLNDEIHIGGHKIVLVKFRLGNCCRRLRHHEKALIKSRNDRLKPHSLSAGQRLKCGDNIRPFFLGLRRKVYRNRERTACISPALHIS
nr:MAG TPA: hypothetical protein [Caudoviricetes sp.]